MHNTAKGFEKAINEFLEDFFNVVVKARDHQKALWAHIDIGTAAHYNEHVFIVHPPHSQYLFTTPIRRADHRPIIMQALCHAFDCPEVKELQLFGNDVDTLKDLALQKLSQGAFSSYRLCTSLFDANPLENAAEAAQKRREVIDKVLSDDKRTQQDELLQGKERNCVVVKTKTRRPDKRFTTDEKDQNKFKGVCVYSANDLVLPDDAGTVENFNCFIRLEGSDVMAGLESLYANDMVVQGKDIPQVLDVNNILYKHLNGCQTKRRKGVDGKEHSQAKSTSNNSVLWMKTE